MKLWFIELWFIKLWFIKKSMRFIRLKQIFLLGLVLTACATPGQRVDQLAAKYGFERKIVNSEKFKHVVYFNPAFKKPASELKNSQGALSLHVYIEGDGSPWLQRQVVAADPTPRNPLALKLMAQDNQPSVYIGRPCYFGLSRSQSCNPLLWTHQRYSQEIVDSIVEVANKIIIEHGSERVMLVGYSGGGVLAMLMAENVLQIDAIVTIAANLDIDAWAILHNYSILEGSINPATQPPLRHEIHQWHLVGKEDENVPPGLVQRVIDKQMDTTKLVSFDGFDHICCWLEQWPTTLLTIQ